MFPVRDPVGPAEPGISAAGSEVIARVVAPFATEADGRGVQRSTIDALAAEGLLGTPLSPSAVHRELSELLAGSDASTWFCWVQHFSPLHILESNSPGHPLLGGLRSGELLCAVAFAHVRRPGPANPVATRVRGGWRLDGTLDWVTSWDIADVVMVMAQGAGDDAGHLVCCYLPAGRSAKQTVGVEAGPALALLAMSGTHTRPLTLNSVFVPDELVGAVLDRERWLADDAVTSADANPSAFGVARGAIAELDLIGEQRSDASLQQLAAALVADCRATRSRAYAAIGKPDVAALDRLRMRAASLDLASRAATAVIVARAGAAMRSGQSAERRLRESMFLQVQAQTAASRRAMIDRLLERSG